MDMTGRANAQRPIAVIQSDLGDRPKDVLANRLERDGPRKKHWHDACTKDVGDPTLGGGKAECAIGGRDQPPGKADPFGLVTVDKLSGRMAVQDRRQLPGKINGVANSGVHALTAGRTV